MKSAVVLLTLIMASGCDLQTMQEAERALNSGTSDGTTTYACGYFAEYDSYQDCVDTTLANCSSEWQTFPSGGAALCYYPVTGWEACAQTATSWIYTPYQVQCQVGATTTHVQARSVIGCSSTICACLDAQVTSSTCTMGSNCPAPTPSPMPACP